MRRRLVSAGLAAVAVLLACNSVFAVGPNEEALVLNLGAPARTANADSRSPGLYAKWPLVERVVRMDRRAKTLDGAPQPIAAAQGRLMVQAALRYRITQPVRFYRELGAGADPLQSILNDSVTAAFTGAGLDGLSGPDEDARIAKALTLARRSVAQRGLGVRLEGLDLLSATPADADAVGRRMQASETAQAAQVRTDGEAHKRELMAAADREAADIRGEGDRQALEIRGDGDAQRASILGVAYAQDPGFARFFRRLEAYDQAFNPDNTTLVLSPDNAFMDLFAHGPQGEPAPRR